MLLVQLILRAIFETLVEEFTWPLIMTLGSLELDLGFFIFLFFRIAHLGTLLVLGLSHLR